MSELQIGDTIQCHDAKDMLSVHADLMRNGIYCDWVNIQELPPTKWKLTVVGFENQKGEQHG